MYGSVLCEVVDFFRNRSNLDVSQVAVSTGWDLWWVFYYCCTCWDSK